MALLSEAMNEESLVRGRTRQRRRAPKTRTGCKTCKIRRIKCDETRPSCQKCTSTGRKCDGYICESAARSLDEELDPISASSAVCPISRKDAGPTTTDNGNSPHQSFKAYEPSNETVDSPFLPFGFPSTHLPGRAFHYFIHRSSKDLTGPLQTQVWHKYVLSVCSTSPAIQHAVVALANFHERYSFPQCGVSHVQCWRQYYLAVKSVSALAQKTSSMEGEQWVVRNEILTACAIFLSIEILIGNVEAALKHLEGGMSLIQQYLIACSIEQRSPLRQLDVGMKDLVGFFARLDLQVLSFLPRNHHSSATRPIEPPKYALLHLAQPPPNGPSSALYRLMKLSLYWVQHRAMPLRFSPPDTIPVELYQTQSNLIAELHTWHDAFLRVEGGEDQTFSTSIVERPKIPPETANLFLAYHLTLLKVLTALSASEAIFSTPDCRESFCVILACASIILPQRHRCKESPCLPHESIPPSALFFSLETSVIEPLYYMALKCRHRTLRRAAALLLKCAGREGVWDGGPMFRVAKHVIGVEEFGKMYRSAYATELAGEYSKAWFDAKELIITIMGGKQYHLSRGGGEGAKGLAEEHLVHDVSVMVDHQERMVDVDLGWYFEKEKIWRHGCISLQW